MSKKMIYLISFVLLVSLASTSYGVVLGDFENPADPNHDGWLVVDANIVTVDYEGTKGVTQGDWSLKIDANEGAQNAIAYDVIGNGMLDEFQKNLKISLDATRMADEWVPDSNGRWTDFAVAVNAGSSGDDPNDPNDPNDWSLWYVMPEQEGDASWLPPDGNNPISLILNYSLAHPQINYDNIEYLEIVIQTNWGGFDPGGTYYIDNIQMFSAGQAYAPSPADEGREILPETTLSWIPGAYGDKHDVYFGTSYNDVNDANASDSTGVYRGRKDANTYDPPGFLDFGKRYYWRIDEVNNAGPDPCLWKGDVWSFTTEYPIVGTVIGDWEQNMDGWGPAWEGSPVFDYNQTPETVTLGEYSLSVQWTGDYWVIQYSAPEVPETLENTTLMFDYTAYGADFSNWAEVGEKIALNSDAAPGWKEYNGRDLAVVIDRNTGEQLDSIDFGSWEEIFQRTFMLDISDYDLTGATWFSIVISCNVDVKTSTGRIYLDYARLVDARLATNPVPTDYEEGVHTEPTLTWTPGKGAVSHDVYFGTDKNAVSDANRTNQLGVFIRQDHDSNSIDIAADPNVGVLELNTIYHWRIDEVNGTDIAKGSVWTFMTGHYLIIDDFESYNPNLEDTWIASSKADVSLSTDPVHGGDQAMAIDYDNNTPAPYYSEAYADTTGPDSLDFGTDWTINGVKGLSLWFRGYPDVRGSFTGSDPYTLEGAGWDIEDTADGFHYAYKELNHSLWRVEARVDSVENTFPWAKAGVMVRETLDPGSRHASVFITPENGALFQWREDPNGDTSEVIEPNIAAPHWVRVTRYLPMGASAYIYAEYSSDGSTWLPIGEPFTWTLSGAITPIYIGLGVTSHDELELCTAEFSNVYMAEDVKYNNLEGTDIGDPNADTDIGVPYNDPEPMYVVLEDSDSDGIVYHTDPNVTQTPAWTHWGIELDEFGAQDVNLEDVQRMYIGIGDPNDPAQGGAGTVYIDDIRLYAPGCTLSSRSADFARADYAPEGSPAGDCVINYKEVEIMGRDWLKTPPPNSDVDLYVDDRIDFKDFAVLAQFWLEEQISLWP